MTPNFDLGEDPLVCAGCRRTLADDETKLAWREHSLQPHCGKCLTEWLEATGRLTQTAAAAPTTVCP